jgi:drug/metabolite transporter (DMT)-like permease
VSPSPRLLAFGAIVLWGISFVATRVALEQLAPAPLLVARFAMGVVLLFGILAARGELRRPPRDTWPILVLLGFLSIFVHQLIQAHALQLTSAVNTGWLIGLTPIWAAILAALFLGERMTPLRVAGLVLGFVGGLVVISRGRFDAGVLALPSAKGDLLILASTLNWAACIVLGRAPTRRLGARAMTTWAIAIGWVMLLPVLFATGGLGAYAHLSARTWAALVFLGVGCSGFGYLWWYGALEHLDASQVAAFLYIEPLVTLVAARIVLDEPVHWPAIVGGLLVLAGVSLVQKPTTQQAAS